MRRKGAESLKAVLIRSPPPLPIISFPERGWTKGIREEELYQSIHESENVIHEAGSRESQARIIYGDRLWVDGFLLEYEEY
ncbi:hypothetical protein TNCV_2776541 [Trichonephila clavipes]|nr:hypothetical protein TNCV_2776541 [Trichonephila clavipes]